jgi:hypothetical protein
MQPKLRLTLLILVAALLALPASATAATKSTTVTIAANALSSATATCSRGQRATGGGFLTTRWDGPSVNVYESRKSGQRSWRVSGRNTFGTAQLLTAYALCSQNAPRTKERAATTTLTGTSFTSLAQIDASCSGSKKAQAGGYSIQTSPLADAFIINSYRSDSRTWRSGATPLTPNPPPLTSYVYCADLKAPKARSATVVLPGNKVGTGLSGECKRGTRVLAGGFSQPGVTITSPASAFVFAINESRKVGKRWQVTGVDNSANPNSLTVTAYCG